MAAGHPQRPVHLAVTRPGMIMLALLGGPGEASAPFLGVFRRCLRRPFPIPGRFIPWVGGVRGRSAC